MLTDDSYTCEHSIIYKDIEDKENLHHYKDTLFLIYNYISPFPSATIANAL